MMSLVRWLCTEKCICTAVSVLCSSRRTWCTTRSMCSSTSRLRTLSRSSSRSRRVSRARPRCPARRSSPAWRCAGLRRFRRACAATGARRAAMFQLSKRARGLEQLGLPVVELAREFAPQLQVAVHHVVDERAASGRPELVGRRARGRRPRVSCEKAAFAVTGRSCGRGVGLSGPAGARRRSRAPRSRCGWTVTSIWSNSAKPTGLVSMRRSTGGPPRRCAGCATAVGAGSVSVGFRCGPCGQSAEHQQVVLRRCSRSARAAAR